MKTEEDLFEGIVPKKMLGRRKKFIEREYQTLTFYIPPYFKPTWKEFVEIALTYTEPEFNEYIKIAMQGKERVTKKRSRISMVIRFLISNFVARQRLEDLKEQKEILLTKEEMPAEPEDEEESDEPAEEDNDPIEESQEDNQIDEIINKVKNDLE